MQAQLWVTGCSPLPHAIVIEKETLHYDNWANTGFSSRNVFSKGHFTSHLPPSVELIGFIKLPASVTDGLTVPTAAQSKVRRENQTALANKSRVPAWGSWLCDLQELRLHSETAGCADSLTQHGTPQPLLPHISCAAKTQPEVTTAHSGNAQGQVLAVLWF